MRMTILALMLLAAPAQAGKDKDGIPNKKDACPTEPEDFDGFEDEDGCPDPDNDGDGILDVDDKCPNEPEDFDGFEDEDGCPDPDNDGDGVPDVDDLCPDEIENDDVKDGCPAVTYEMLNGEGWVPAVKELNDGLVPLLAKKAEACDDAAGIAKAWLAKHDADKLHATFEARAGRAPEGVDPNLSRKVLEAQAGVWPSTSKVFAIYCEKHADWPGLAPKLDAVYAKAKKAE